MTRGFCQVIKKHDILEILQMLYIFSLLNTSFLDLFFGNTNRNKKNIICIKLAIFFGFLNNRF